MVNGTTSGRKEAIMSEPTVEYPIELMVEFAARDVLVPASEDASISLSGPRVYDIASQIAHRFTEIRTEWTEHGRALEADEKPPLHPR
jgi:hypothetical protein